MRTRTALLGTAIGLVVVIGCLGLLHPGTRRSPVAPVTTFTPPARTAPKPLPLPDPSNPATISVRLPRPDGDLGSGLWTPPTDDLLSDDALALGLTSVSKDVPGYDLVDITREIYRAVGFRPADHAAWLAKIDPDLAYDFLLQASEWRRRDALRGVARPLPARFDDERSLAAAIETWAPNHPTADNARWALFQADVAGQPPEERAAAVWGGTMRIIERTKGNNFAWAVATRTLPEPPRLTPQDHEVLEAMADRRSGRIAGQIADLALRDALQNGDESRIRSWWDRLRSARPRLEGVAPVHRERAIENQAELTGPVLAATGEATRWDDGVRRAAVVCTAHAHDLDVRLSADASGWQAPERVDAYVACILGEARPAPPPGQQVTLIVRVPDRLP